jgi:serine/threonine protein kinase
LAGFWAALSPPGIAETKGPMSNRPIANPAFDPYALTSGLEPVASVSAWPPPLGTRIGRYIVRGTLGEGGMGHVLDAFDPMLERRVALKIVRRSKTNHSVSLHTSATINDGDRILQREANGMAKLGHPNVVPVFDVGFFDGAYFIAMALVHGTTLSGWLKDAERDYREILAMLIQAAQGLDAIHSIGLVHCDIKPSNLLIDESGVLQVSDFGLVRRIERTPHPNRIGERISQRMAQSQLSMDNTDAPGGTFSYMSPEQHEGQALDDRADQFSFFVTLYFAMTGELPFAGGDSIEILAAIERGISTEIYCNDRRIPRPLAQIIAKGLAYDADARFDSMKQVVEVLLAVQGSSVTRRVFPIAALALGLATAVTASLTATPSDPLCEAMQIRADKIWSNAAKTELNHHVLAQSLAQPTAIVKRIESAIDDKIETWSRSIKSECKSQPILDREQALCLQSALSGIGSAINVLQGANPETLNEPGRVLASIPDVGECAKHRESALFRTPWPEDEADQKEAAALREEILHLRMFSLAGVLDPVRSAYAEILPKAQKLNFLPILAELEQETGMAFSQFLELDESEEHFRRATLFATASDYAKVAGWAMTSDVYALTYTKFEPYEFVESSQNSRTAIMRAGDPPELVSEWLNNIGLVQLNSGNSVAAARILQEAFQKSTSSTSFSYLTPISRLNNIAIALIDAGQLDEAYRLLYQAYERINNIGASRVERSLIFINLGRVTNDLGRYREATRWTLLGFRNGIQPDGSFTAEVDFPCTYIQDIERSRGRFDRAMQWQRACPAEGVALGNSPDLHAMVNGFYEALALEDAGYLRAANQRTQNALALLDNFRDVRAKLFGSSILYSSTRTTTRYKLAQDISEMFQDALHNVVHLPPSSPEFAMLQLDALWFELASKVSMPLNEFACCGESTHLALRVDEIDLEATMQTVHTFESAFGPSHPRVLDIGMRALDIFQAAGDTKRSATLLRDLLAQRDYWSTEVPERQGALELVALRRMAKDGAWESAREHWQAFLRLGELQPRRLRFSERALSSVLDAFDEAMASHSLREAGSELPELAWRAELVAARDYYRERLVAREGIDFHPELLDAIGAEVARNHPARPALLELIGIYEQELKL